MPATDVISQFIYSILSQDAVIVSNVGKLPGSSTIPGIYGGIVPSDAAYPIIVYNMTRPSPDVGSDNRIYLETATAKIEIADRNISSYAGKLKILTTRVIQLLHAKQLTTTDGSVHYSIYSGESLLSEIINGIEYKRRFIDFTIAVNDTIISQVQ